MSGCQWIGPEQQGPIYKRLCSCGSLEGRSYCDGHLAQVYQVGTALYKRRKDIRRATAVWDISSDLNTVIQELEAEGVL
jgi:CDGSH-type Zn-finger protein